MGSQADRSRTRHQQNTVKVYLRKGIWVPYGRPARKRMLDGQASWVAESYLQHRGNADVVRQELG
jgi:hypothetical protein